MNRRQLLKLFGAGVPTVFTLPTRFIKSANSNTLIKKGDATRQERGTHLPFLMPDDFEEFNLVYWRVEQGNNDPHNPLLEPAMPWDEGGVMANGTVLHDPLDGLWKTWQISTSKSEIIIEPRFRTEHERRLTYLESEDGGKWYRPELRFVSWGNYKRTNIIFNYDSGGKSTYASVLVDPDNEKWPYEMFVFREPLYKNPSKRVGHLPPPNRGKRATYRYRSKDGKEWEVFQGPLKIATGDILYIYRQPDKSYIMYNKKTVPGFPGSVTAYDNNAAGVRVIAMRKSKNGVNWTPPETVLTPDWRDNNDIQFLELCPLAVPGGYVASVTTYHSLIQTMSIQWAVSRDGVNWWRPVMGTLEALLVTQTGIPTIILSSSLYGFILTSFRVVAYLLIGALVFGVNMSGANLPAALLILILTIICFSGIGIISASFIMVLKGGLIHEYSVYDTT